MTQFRTLHEQFEVLFAQCNDLARYKRELQLELQIGLSSLDELNNRLKSGQMFSKDEVVTMFLLTFLSVQIQFEDFTQKNNTFSSKQRFLEVSKATRTKELEALQADLKNISWTQEATENIFSSKIKAFQEQGCVGEKHFAR